MLKKPGMILRTRSDDFDNYSMNQSFLFHTCNFINIPYKSLFYIISIFGNISVMTILTCISILGTIPVILLIKNWLQHIASNIFG